MADAFEKVGKDGVITVEEGKTSDTDARIRRGHAVRQGLHLALLRHRPDGDEVRAGRLPTSSSTKRSCPTSATCCRCWKRSHTAGKPLLIIAEDVESEALAALGRQQAPRRAADLRRQGARLRRSPQGHAGRHRRADRRQFISEDLGIKLENVDARAARPGQDGSRGEGNHARSSTAPARRPTSRSASSRSAPRWSRPKASTTRKSSANGWPS